MIISTRSFLSYPIPRMAGAGSLWRREAVFLTAMLASETGIVGINILFKAATSKGLNSYSYLGYSYLLASLLLLPFPFFSYRFLTTSNFWTILVTILFFIDFISFLCFSFTGQDHFLH